MYRIVNYQHNCLIARVGFIRMIQKTRRAYLQVCVVEAPVNLWEVVGIPRPLAPFRMFRRGAGLLAIDPSFDHSVTKSTPSFDFVLARVE